MCISVVWNATVLNGYLLTFLRNSFVFVQQPPFMVAPGMAPMVGMAPYGMNMPQGGPMMMQNAGMMPTMYNSAPTAYNVQHVILSIY